VSAGSVLARRVGATLRAPLPAKIRT
jgi:hypothetical protein